MGSLTHIIALRTWGSVMYTGFRLEVIAHAAPPGTHHSLVAAHESVTSKSIRPAAKPRKYGFHRRSAISCGLSAMG